VSAVATVAVLLAAGIVSWLLRIAAITLWPAPRLPAAVHRVLAHAAPAAIAAMAATPAAAYRATVRCLTTFNRRNDTGRITAPTLLLAGERDPLAPPKTMERMRDVIRDARLAVLPGCGHLAHLEDPEGFNAAVQGFLRGLREG
jgi:pimeloyl-ACP methyl ester carboxylesterase